jgi:hypothetical protein
MEVEEVSELLGIARFMFHEGKVDDFETGGGVQVAMKPVPASPRSRWVWLV